MKLPTIAELEQRGAKVGAIEIKVEDIFDPTKPGEDATLYRWANDLHMLTRDDAVRSQLLFKESEPVSQQKIAETERLLRGRRYLYDAWIEPTCYDAAAQTVDLRVRVRDVWSLNPGFTFNRKGGANRVGFELEDQDFFGRGEFVSASVGRNVDRDTLLLVYEDPQILGTWWRGRVAYANNSDGGAGEFAVGQPFYSLDTRWSAGLGLAAGDRINSRYQLGQVLDAFAETTDRFEVYGGRSQGLRDGWARRWLAGVRYEDSRFSETRRRTRRAPSAGPQARLPLGGRGMDRGRFRYVAQPGPVGAHGGPPVWPFYARGTRLSCTGLGLRPNGCDCQSQGGTGKRIGAAQSLFFTGSCVAAWRVTD
ncbi:MAG: hypothetical protein IPJ97_17725 [Proteobacteria bacterium]|nr:hypothetical protein [Pseudomonadota bacterium]